MFRVTTTRAYSSAAGAGRRVYTVVQRQPSWVTRAAMFAVLVAIGAVLLLVVVPLAILAMPIGAVVFLVAAVAGWVQSLFSGGQPRGGAGPGDTAGVRRNVRVIDRDDH